jgi:hypothetical protein
MGFLAPFNLLAALSLLGLVLIYLRARTRATVEVSSLLLFEESEAATSSFRFLRLDRFFWIEAGALLLLTLALAGLFLKLPPVGGPVRRQALVFDLGAAMGARDGSYTRLDLARRRALKIIAAAHPGDQISVIGYTMQPVVGCPFTANLSTVRAAIAALQPADVAATATGLAAALMRVRESDRIDLLAPDLPTGAEDIARAAGDRLHFDQVGASADNAALVGLDPGIPGKTPGHVTVRNMSNHPMLVAVGVFASGTNPFQTTLIMPPKITLPVAFGPLRAPGIIQARILTSDALPADNTRYAYAPPNRPLKSVVLSPDPAVRDDLARVLRAIAPTGQVLAGDPARLTPQNIDDFEHGGRPDLVILHDSDDIAIAAVAKLLIFPHSSPAVRVRATLPASELDDRSDLGPLTRPLALGPTREIDLPSWIDPLASGTALHSNRVLTMAAYGASPNGRLGVIAFDIRQHRLLDPDMMDTLVLTVDLIHTLTAPRDVQVVSTGSYVSIPAVSVAKIRQPDGTLLTLTPGYGERIRFRPMHAGAYEITVGKRKELVLANYFDARESDLTVSKRHLQRTRSAPPSSSIAFALIAPAPRIRPVGEILLFLVLAAMVIEAALLLVQRERRGGASIV